MKIARPSTSIDLAERLADAFEASMYKLTLIGNNLPKAVEGLTPPQLRLLSILAFASQPLTMARAAAQVGVASGTLTESVKRLVKSGLILRQRGPDNDRIVELSLSETGNSVVAEVHSRRVELFREIRMAIDESAGRDLIDSHRFIADIYSSVIQNKANAGGAA